MKQGTLNRKQYDKIRKMDHGQMQDRTGTAYLRKGQRIFREKGVA